MQLYWIWLSMLPGISEREKRYMLAYFGSPEDCYHGEEADFAGMEELHQSAAEALQNKDLTQARGILRLCEKYGIEILTFYDKRFPVVLRNIPDPPLVLYYRGKLPEFNTRPMIGVVGTRKASVYGLKSARQLGKELTQHGMLVVSGMAEGIDAMATWGALDACGTPVGVLGCGVDRIYPRCNRDLFRKMEHEGCLLSEYPPGTPPNRWQFPRRNRIISGLSCGVLVVEAPEKSGALITARQALEQGRDVYVVPGNIGVETCAGSNGLLRDGAVAVMSGWDIAGEYVYHYPSIITREIPKQVQITEK